MRINNDPNRFIGNADLNPSFVNSFEFSYNYNRSKWNINPSIYYQKTTDDIGFVTERKSYNNPITGEFTEYILSKPYNLGTEEKYGMELNYNVNPINWLRIYGNVNLFRYKNKMTFNNKTIANEGNVATARLTTTIRMDKTMNFQLQGQFRGGHTDFTTTRKDSYSLNIGLSKNIWDNAGTINFSVQDVFNSRKMRNTTISDTFTRYSEMQMTPRQFLLSFSYRFKSGEVKEQKNKKPTIQNQNNEEINEVAF